VGEAETVDGVGEGMSKSSFGLNVQLGENDARVDCEDETDEVVLREVEGAAGAMLGRSESQKASSLVGGPSRRLLDVDGGVRVS
jgi:hypothetical protein